MSDLDYCNVSFIFSFPAPTSNLSSNTEGGSESRSLLPPSLSSNHLSLNSRQLDYSSVLSILLLKEWYNTKLRRFRAGRLEDLGCGQYLCHIPAVYTQTIESFLVANYFKNYNSNTTFSVESVSHAIMSDSLSPHGL